MYLPLKLIFLPLKTAKGIYFFMGFVRIKIVLLLFVQTVALVHPKVRHILILVLVHYQA